MGVPLPASGFYLGSQPTQQNNKIFSSRKSEADLAAGSAVSPPGPENACWPTFHSQ